jgi:hypothetical protein
MRMSPDNWLRIRVSLISIALLIPCFWKRSIQAGDLGSHIYNAWLAHQIELGKAPGLVIVPVTTNVLFDLSLEWLLRALGPEPAQRIAVSIAALLFFWGAFQLIYTVSGARPWFLTPCLAMLSYGWVFHMGFFNFYLALGLSLWALALQLPRKRPHLGAAALLGLAYAGHVLPPVWAIAVLAYTLIARKLGSRPRLILLVSAMCSIAALNVWLTRHYNTFSSFHQTLEAGAVDQVWIFGLKYFAISIGLALLWGFLLLGVTHVKGLAGTISDSWFQLCLLMALGILILPTRIEFPLYGTAIAFVSERMTLPYGVMICAFLATVNPPKWLKISFLPLAILYFSFLYADVSSFARVEAAMAHLTERLSPTDRVFTSLVDPMSRVQLWPHMLDRACVEKCISYANYEPFSKMFRIRVTGPNRYSVDSAADLATLRDGGYVVKQDDIPMYEVTTCDETGRNLCLKSLQAGEVTRRSNNLSVAPFLW